MKVLVADDEGTIRLLLVRLLAQRGIEGIACEDGDRALELALKNPPDLILTDLEMPGLHGPQLVRRLRSEASLKEVPIIVLTGMATRENVLAVLESGASDLIVKNDLNLTALLERIGKFVKLPPPVPPAVPPAVALPPAAKAPKAPKTPQPPKPARPRKTSGLTREQVDLRLKDAVELKALPFVVAEIIQVTSNPAADGALLTQAVARDPAVAARVLQVANSVSYTPRGRFQTLAQAVTRLGFRQVREIAISLKLLETFGPSPGKAGLDRIRFWKHALAGAVLARELAGLAGSTAEDREAAFLAGLLHNIGQSFLMDQFPKAYERILARASKQGRALPEVERETCGVGHPEVSRRILAKWQILGEFLEAVDAHHLPARDWKGEAESLRRPGILWMACLLAKVTGIGTDGDETLEEVPDALAYLLGLDALKVAGLLDQTQGHVEKLAQILLLHEQGPSSREPRPEPLAEGVRCALVYQAPPLIDPMELLLTRARWAPYRSLSLAKAVMDEEAGAVLVRARTMDWLRVQVEQAFKAGGGKTKGRRPLGVLLDGPPPKDLGISLKRLGAVRLGSPLHVPGLRALLRGARS